MAERQRVQPDDEVYRVRAIWLGPRGLTLPFSARYLAWGIWLGFFVAMLLVEGVTIGLHHLPMWELSASIFATYLVMQVVDYERPFMAHVKATRREVVRVLSRCSPKGYTADVTLKVAVGAKSRRKLPRRHRRPPGTGVAATQAVTPVPAVKAVRRIPRPRLPRFALPARPGRRPTLTQSRSRRVAARPAAHADGGVTTLAICLGLPLLWGLLALGRHLFNA